MAFSPSPGSGNPPASDLDLKPGKGYCLIRIRVTPKASRNEVVGIVEGCLRIRIQAPPVEGAANEKAREFLAELLGLSRRDVELEKGQTNRVKVFRIAGLGEAEIRNRISASLTGT